MRRVMTSGVFDLLHVGHLNIIKQSKGLGDFLFVGVVSDKGAAAYKRTPIMPEQERLELVRALKWVDYAAIQDTTDPTPLLEQWQPDIYTHGDDWQQLIRGQETIEENNIEFVLLPYTQGISTSELLTRIKSMV